MPVKITSTGHTVPPDLITNDELVESFNAYVALYNQQHADQIARGEVVPLQTSSSEFIEKASGIKSRYVVNKSGILDVARMHPLLAKRSIDQRSIQAEMGLEAVAKAFAKRPTDPASIDQIIVSCAMLNRAYPAISAEIQNALGAGGGAFDMQMACSAGTFALFQAYATIKAGLAKKILVVIPELASPQVNWRQRDSHFLFGDLASAVLLEETDDPGFEIVDAKTVTMFSTAIRNEFSILNMSDPETHFSPEQTFFQDGRKVYKEVSPFVAKNIADHLEKNGLTIHDMKRFWLHQANLNMNHLILKLMFGHEIPFERAPTVLEKYGNTGPVGCLLAFEKYSEDFKPGDYGILCSFGAGYSLGSAIVRYTA